MSRIDAAQIPALVALAQEAKEFSYSPYSKFRVGCSVLCPDGTFYSGCNIENAVYPLGVCAEKSAVSKAISDGQRKIVATAIASDMRDHFIVPCGSCRQFLSEFGMDMDVFMAKPDNTYRRMTIRQLLPLGFEPDKLQEDKITNSEPTENHSTTPLTD